MDSNTIQYVHDQVWYFSWHVLFKAGEFEISSNKQKSYLLHFMRVYCDVLISPKFLLQ